MAGVRPISYSQIIDTIKSGLKICFRKLAGENVQPNRFILFFSSNDRKIREKAENILRTEIANDLNLFLNLMTGESSDNKVKVDIRTDTTLSSGDIRVDYYIDARLLFRFSQDGDSQSMVDLDSETNEWDAVEMLPKVKKSGKNVLIVDDEPVLCAVLNRMLTKLGYQAVSAHDGVAAMRILSHMDIDLVISDLRMPMMDGWALMKHVKKRNPKIPVILITGYHSIHTQSRASASSADGYLSKPFSLGQVRELLELVFK